MPDHSFALSRRNVEAASVSILIATASLHASSYRRTRDETQTEFHYLLERQRIRHSLALRRRPSSQSRCVAYNALIRRDGATQRSNGQLPKDV